MDNPVAITEEPLHVVRYRDSHFLIYTNRIESEIWTLYHQHRNDQIAVIAADVRAASQTPGSEPKEQAAPAGTIIFFPYADSAEAFVHRVGARGGTTFINVGLDFLDPPTTACSKGDMLWSERRASVLEASRRGQPYRLALPPGQTTVLPPSGRGLLMVRLDATPLEYDGAGWGAGVGDFQFFTGDRPSQLTNTGAQTATLIVFVAC